MFRSSLDGRLWLGRFAGLLWLAAWVSALYLVASPWEHLGGIVSERLRWLARFVLGSGLIVGFSLGRWMRELPRGHSYLGFARCLLYPAGLLAASGLILLQLGGQQNRVGIVFTAWMAYWCGVDAACGALPLLEEGSLVPPLIGRNRLPP